MIGLTLVQYLDAIAALTLALTSELVRYQVLEKNETRSVGPDILIAADFQPSESDTL